jgi:hypothetical protein
MRIIRAKIARDIFIVVIARLFITDFYGAHLFIAQRRWETTAPGVEPLQLGMFAYQAVHQDDK